MFSLNSTKRTRCSTISKMCTLSTVVIQEKYKSDTTFLSSSMALFPDWVFPSTVGAWLGLLMDVFLELDQEDAVFNHFQDVYTIHRRDSRKI
mmetsp:Transcript_27097/g.58007  ORF Transcript_27097/g.58007 Transcript_27097/m.58007 type:complete len:92 (+) Transcript_27097:19-294(+)